MTWVQVFWKVILFFAVLAAIQGLITTIVVGASGAGGEFLPVGIVPLVVGLVVAYFAYKYSK